MFLDIMKASTAHTGFRFHYIWIVGVPKFMQVMLTKALSTEDLFFMSRYICLFFDFVAGIMLVVY